MINRLENIHRVEDTVSKHRDNASNIERVEESGRITIMNPLHKNFQGASARSIEMINRLENIHRVEDTVSKHRDNASNIERVDDEIHVHTTEHDEEVEHVAPTQKVTL
eukprot:g6080.t1